MSMTQPKTNQATLIYQIAAAGCLGVGIWIGVDGIPQSSVEATIERISDTTIAQPSTPTTTKAPQPEQVDITHRANATSIAARLSMLDNAPVLVVAEEPDSEQVVIEDEPIQDNTGILRKRVKFTGFIQDDQTPMAFLQIDGMQKIAGEEQVLMSGSVGLDDLTLLRVRRDHILITDGTNTDKIPLAAKSGNAITMAGGGTVAESPVPLREEDVVLTPEELASLEGLSVRARRARERMLKRQKLGVEKKRRPMEPLASFRGDFSEPGKVIDRRNEGRDEQPQ